MEYNTPSGKLETALDKFVYRFTSKGYSYEIENNTIIFKKGEQIVKAIPVYNKKGWITGYTLS